MHPATPAILLLSAWLTIQAVADGGRIIESVDLGDAHATVMATPWPLRAGPADIGLFLQDKDGKPVMDASVRMEWSAEGPGEEWVPPCCRMKSPAGSVTASRDHGQNRLIHSATLTIPGSGKGILRVTVEHAGTTETINVPAVAEPPAPPALAYLPWLAMTPLAIGAYALHQKIRRRRHR